jgi:hypothetical protein
MKNKKKEHENNKTKQKPSSSAASLPISAIRSWRFASIRAFASSDFLAAESTLYLHNKFSDFFRIFRLFFPITPLSRE